MKRHYVVACLAAIIFYPSLSFAQQAGESGLPIPRFVSLKSGEANLRTGPGTRYPIRYIYQRAGLPLEVTAEYLQWRELRDPDGDSGWMHKTMLSGKRTGYISNESQLHRKPSVSAPVAATLKPGVLIELDECSKDWCLVETQDISGWIQKTDMWGAYAAEDFD